MFRFFQKIYLKLQNEVCCEVYCGVSIFFQKKTPQLKWFRRSLVQQLQHGHRFVCGGAYEQKNIARSDQQGWQRQRLHKKYYWTLSIWHICEVRFVSNRYGSLPLVFTVLFALSMIRFSPTLELLSPLSALQELCV